ncbi:PEP-CTERM/exosortase system-associated acyltransferase [Brumicola nitratireducens]|uniref:PEP-CTERM/exosortase system-associated acyltransferase n=1 Tax=Brumicola nitratireducens TaxID=300231 RepID=UPI0002EB8735|nr:PEP-CTERM/exosortase system-associated acyltransferase [Glaciecola nitratireducens]
MSIHSIQQRLFPNAVTKRRSNKLVAFIKKSWGSYQKLKEAHEISYHFSQFLAPVIANSHHKKQCVYGLRHNVYCEELNFEPIKDDKQEIDEFDAFSEYCLIQHVHSEAFAGTVRVVSPMKEGELLPIEKYCMNTITDDNFSPTNFKRAEICEISRLAVPAAFRRRKADHFIGAATGNINKFIYSETELRCFPFIAVGLYFSAAALALKLDKKHAFVMMEPRLAKSMGYVGIKFKQIGPVVDYHGKRAPYYINADLLYSNLSKGFKVMLENIQEHIDGQKIEL